MSNNTYTYATIAIPGAQSARELRKLIADLGQAFAVVSTRQQKTPPKSSVTQELPHAFAEFDVSVPCANDPLWDAGAVDNREDSRPDLNAIRNLRIETTSNREETEH